MPLNGGPSPPQSGSHGSWRIPLESLIKSMPARAIRSVIAKYVSSGAALLSSNRPPSTTFLIVRPYYTVIVSDMLWDESHCWCSSVHLSCWCPEPSPIASMPIEGSTPCSMLDWQAEQQQSGTSHSQLRLCTVSWPWQSPGLLFGPGGMCCEIHA